MFVGVINQSTVLCRAVVFAYFGIGDIFIRNNGHRADNLTIKCNLTVAVYCILIQRSIKINLASRDLIVGLCQVCFIGKLQFYFSVFHPVRTNGCIAVFNIAFALTGNGVQSFRNIKIVNIIRLNIIQRCIIEHNVYFIAHMNLCSFRKRSWLEVCCSLRLNFKLVAGYRININKIN